MTGDVDEERRGEMLDHYEFCAERYGEDPREIPDEKNEFIKYCDRQFTLTGLAAVKGDAVHPGPPGEASDLSAFGGGSGE